MNITNCVSFKGLLERYDVSQSNLSHRIKKLRLKTQKRGRNTYITVNQMHILDKLHKFLQENPSSTIDAFMASHHQSFIDSSTRRESIIYESMNHRTIDDSLMMHQSINDASMGARNQANTKKSAHKLIQDSLQEQTNELEQQLENDQEVNKFLSDLVKTKEQILKEKNQKIIELNRQLFHQREEINKLEKQLTDKEKIIRMERDFLINEMKPLLDEKIIPLLETSVVELKAQCRENQQLKEEVERWNSVFPLPFCANDVQVMQRHEDTQFSLWVRCHTIPWYTDAPAILLNQYLLNPSGRSNYRRI